MPQQIEEQDVAQVDAHQHYWNPARGDYGWMPKDDKILTRIYMPADLSPELEAHGIDATVLVQAAPTVEETEYLLGIADATPHVAGVVGWVDFERPQDRKQLERLAKHPKFCGVRPMIQDIPDKDWMLRADVQWGFEALSELDLTFDALGFPIHLENFLTILKRYPDTRTVIDHCMKPEIRDHSPERFQHWANGMSRLAKETNAFCKLSGLVTEASEAWATEDLKPYAEHVLSEFGAERVMWGSDWPVCRLRAQYSNWRMVAEDLTAHLSTKERKRIFGETATEFYRLGI
ncbi:amidohydrolase family protein [Stappia sp. GBMRC 2046]|uniref:Amidohydrolase family protein n=1 Tax=Stappia sediminis TaxID=2692190 RepID=A0A7X3SA10_9HYPH|nr:amidohydrolase family protein [Stappia sediminis]